ncbi:hypothetical protein GCM10009670_05740 [Citricoccus alkalitolerans]
MPFRFLKVAARRSDRELNTAVLFLRVRGWRKLPVPKGIKSDGAGPRLLAGPLADVTPYFTPTEVVSRCAGVAASTVSCSPVSGDSE